MAALSPFPAPLTDGHGRRIDYLRLSVTDRCDLRCRYCMAEDMTFLPRSAVLSIEEMGDLAARFVARGIRRIRLTGGEPLVRRGIDMLAARLGALIGHGLDELTLTTNAMRLAEHAPMLAAAGVRRINVSLDTLDPEAFRHITRVGDLAAALRGIDAAQNAGLAVKINMVALAGLNEDQLLPMLDYCGNNGFDHAGQVFVVGAACVLGIKFHVTHEVAGPFYGLDGPFKDLFLCGIEFAFYMEIGCSDASMDTGSFCEPEGFSGHFDVFLDCPAEAADGGVLYDLRDLLYGVKIAGAGDGKACLDDVHAQGFQLLSQFDLFGGIELTARHLLPIAEGGIKNENLFVGHRSF